MTWEKTADGAMPLPRPLPRAAAHSLEVNCCRIDPLGARRRGGWRDGEFWILLEEKWRYWRYLDNIWNILGILFDCQACEYSLAHHGQLDKFNCS